MKYLHEYTNYKRCADQNFQAYRSEVRDRHKDMYYDAIVLLLLLAVVAVAVTVLGVTRGRVVHY